MTFSDKAKTFSQYRLSRRRTGLFLPARQPPPLQLRELFQKSLQFLIILNRSIAPALPTLWERRVDEAYRDGSGPDNETWGSPRAQRQLSLPQVWFRTERVPRKSRLEWANSATRERRRRSGGAKVVRDRRVAILYIFTIRSPTFVKEKKRMRICPENGLRLDLNIKPQR